MSVKEVNTSNSEFTLQLTFKFNKSMLQGEMDILNTINMAGTLATEKLLKNFDADGSPIKIGNQTFTSKGLQGKDYQTPYGTARVERHIYQSHSGGKTFCPLEEDARIIITSTPKFAQMTASKYSQMSAPSVKADLANNHGRVVQNKLIQDVSEAVGTFLTAKEGTWNYDVPEFEEVIKGISIGLDGTCMQMKDDGWREAMTGTISLYNKFGDNMHTTYVAAPPEYGKELFLNKFVNEIIRVKEKNPDVPTIGLADGAKANWPFLNQHTDFQLIDFYHASEYIGKVGKAAYKDVKERESWIEDQCHKLKHNTGGASRLINEIKDLRKNIKKHEDKEAVDAAISYFSNNDNENRMQYYKYEDSVLPIGSGATEAACKVIVKQRMCKSGMRWRNDGAQVVLALRSSHETKGRWNQFWSKIDQYGFALAS